MRNTILLIKRLKTLFLSFQRNGQFRSIIRAGEWIALYLFLILSLLSITLQMRPLYLLNMSMEESVFGAMTSGWERKVHDCLLQRVKADLMVHLSGKYGRMWTLTSRGQSGLTCPGQPTLEYREVG